MVCAIEQSLDRENLKLRKSEGWFDDKLDSSVKAIWLLSTDKQLFPLFDDTKAALRDMAKARVFHVSFWANDAQRYVHTFPVAGLAAHFAFLGIATKSNPVR